MKRAVIWRSTVSRLWHCAPDPDCATDEFGFEGVHPTHTAALAHALHEVGLTPTNPEPMEAP